MFGAGWHSMMNEEEVVRAFGALWERRDVDRIVGAMTPDCVYINVPLPPMRGHEEVRRFVQPNLTKADAIEFRFLVVATAANGGSVLTERVDAFVFGTKRVEVPVMGIFVVRDGKISECPVAPVPPLRRGGGR
jgi:limonene-1,2-epoxide hydrolase